MEALPPAVTEDGLELVKAMVSVGPPLLARELRKGLPEMSPEPDELPVVLFKLPSCTRLLRLVPMEPLPA